MGKVKEGHATTECAKGYAKLTVLVQSDAGDPIKTASVQVKAEKGSGKCTLKTNAEGKVIFTVKAGSYQADVSADNSSATQDPKQPFEGNTHMGIALAAKAEQEVTVDLRPLAETVTPHIDAEVTTVRCPAPKPEPAEGEQAQDEDDDEAGVKPTPVEVYMTRSVENSGYEGGGTLTIPGDLEVFSDEACTQALADGATLTFNQLTQKETLKLYLRGTKEGKLKLKLALDDPPYDAITVAAPAEKEFDLKELVLLTPKVELEYLVVQLDRGLSKHLGKKEEKVTTDGTKVLLSLTQSRADPKYDKGIFLELDPPASAEIYTDKELTKKLKLKKPIPYASVSGAEPYALYLKGLHKGRFTLTATVEEAKKEKDRSPEFKAGKPVVSNMAVVELELQLHQHDAETLKGVTVDPNVDDVDDYYTALKDKELPKQKKIEEDKDKVQKGRLLHVQDQGHNGRARVLIAQANADDWPEEGCDDYELVINEENASGALEVFDKPDGDDTAQAMPFPIKLKLSDLLNAETELWVEGKTVTDAALDARLDLGLDRKTEGPAHEPKRNGDWARFTVVKIEELKLDYTAPKGKANAWDEAEERFYINLEKKKGRTIKLKAKLSKAIKDVQIHFMLSPDANNRKAANWGVDLPDDATLPPGPFTYALTGGSDLANYSLAGADLKIDDGVLDEDTKNYYTVKYSATDADGVAYPFDYTLDVEDRGANGADTTGGSTVATLEFTQTTVTKWNWKDVTWDVKRKDKEKPEDLLHLFAKTDKDGVATCELVLSRFGGDVFHPGAYVDQDPHLAKYFHEHPDLGTRKPTLAAKKITVWRKLFYQRVTVAGLTAVPAFTPAEQQYERVKVKAEDAGDLAVPRAKVAKYKPQAIYPSYMVKVNGGNADVLVVSDTNKSQFFKTFKTEKDKPNKVPVLVCDAQWDPDGTAGPASPPKRKASAFAPNGLPIWVGKKILDPPLQGGKLLVSGKWVAKDKKTDGTWINERKGNLKSSDLSISPTRGALSHIVVSLPSGVGAAKPNTETWVWLKDVKVKAAASYLGESFKKRILAVYDSTEATDFQNTIVHELGHAYGQVMHGAPATGVPAHPNQADEGQGNHCRHLMDKCVMYDSGPIEGSLNRYCDVCHPHLLVRDMTTIS